MSVQGVNSGGLTVSARRIAAMVVTVGCHLGLLIMLLRPATPYADADLPVARENTAAALKLRFILLLRPTTTAVSPALRLVPPSSHVFQKASVKEAIRAVHVTARSASTNVPPSRVVPVPPNVPAAPDPFTNSQTSTEDGGFRNRLLDAQHANDIRGVPGSDRPIVPGIQLINPRNQGVGAVVRKVQRLFGITDHHCIDAEVLQSLTPEELIARHHTLEDVKAEAEKYNCYQPPGLHF